MSHKCNCWDNAKAETFFSHYKCDTIKLASVLQVSVEYLLNNDISDPQYGIEKAPYMEEARRRLGVRVAKEMDTLLEQNMALFAGGELDQEAKDAFFEAVMKAYLKCKEESRKTFGKSVVRNKGDITSQ